VPRCSIGPAPEDTIRIYEEVSSIKKNKRTYVEDLLSNKPTPTERPIQSLHGSVSREEVVSPDVRVLRKRVEAFAHNYE
jgi:hypothetical protein